MRGPALRDARLLAGLTQAQLAGMVGVTRVTVARWERACEAPPGAARAAEAVLPLARARARDILQAVEA